MPCFDTIDKQPRNIKKARKPSNHKNQVQGFYIVVMFGHSSSIVKPASRRTVQKLNLAPFLRTEIYNGRKETIMFRLKIALPSTMYALHFSTF